MDTTLRLSRSIVSRRSLASSSDAKVLQLLLLLLFFRRKVLKVKRQQKQKWQNNADLGYQRDTAQRKEKRKKAWKAQKLCTIFLCFLCCRSVVRIKWTTLLVLHTFVEETSASHPHQRSLSIYTVLARTISISVPYFTLHYIYFTFWSSGVSIPVSHKLILDWISTYNTEYVGRICFRQIYELPVWIDQNKNDKNLGHNSYCTSTGGSASNLSSIHEFILHKFVAREREAF